MKYDYKQIKAEYMRDSTLTLNGLAQKHGMATTTPLYRIAKREHWESERAKKCEKRIEREDALAEKESLTQSEAWNALQIKMRDVIDREWDKIRAEKHPSGGQVSALARATRDARDMGVYGVTLNEKRTLKEIERLEKELAEASKDPAESGVVVKIEGGDGYAD